MGSERNGEVDIEEEVLLYDRPASPTAQFFNSSVLSICIFAVVEFETPVDKAIAINMLKNMFLPINHRFSCIMVADEQGEKQWRAVKVNVEDHVKVPIFPDGLMTESYDNHLQEYMSKIAVDQLPKTRPLWELHIFNYPTSNAVASVIFKLHHALGDGYSLMGALLSCSHRVDDPSLPLTFPSLRSDHNKKKSMYKNVVHGTSVLFNTTLDFISSVFKSTVVADDPTPVRSRIDGMEFRPLNITSTTFSLDHIKQIKTKLGGSQTVNDIVVGTIFYGLRLYMQSESKDSNHRRSTALVLLNTRGMNGYRTVDEMVKPNAESAWGNQFGFMHIPIPKSKDVETDDPLKFISKAREMIQRNKNSLSVYFTGLLLDSMRKLRGPETASRYIYTTLRNSSMAITNVIGPIEQIALANYKCNGLYFMVVNSPQSLVITIMSYMGKVRVAIGAEKDYINPQQLISCFDNAFQKIFQAALAIKS